MKKILLCMLMSIWWAGAVLAGNTVVLTANDGVPGDTVTVQVAMTATDRVVAAEFSVPVVDGLSYVNGSLLTDAEEMSSSSTYSDGELRVYFFSTDLNKAQLLNGNLFSFNVVLGRTPGVFRIQSSAVLSDAQGRPLRVEVTGRDISVKAPQIIVSSETIDFGHIAIRSTYTAYMGVTNVGTTPLNVMSVTASSAEVSVSETKFAVQPGASEKLRISFTPTATGRREIALTIVSDAIDNEITTVQVVSDAYSVNELKVSSATGESDSDIGVDLLLDNMEELVALECAFKLPEGLNYVEGSFEAAERLKDMACFTSVEAGVFKVFVYQEAEGFIAEGQGRVASFKLHLGSPGGQYRLVPESVVLANRNLDNAVSGIAGGLVEIMSPQTDCAAAFDMGKNAMSGTVTGEYLISNTGKKDLIIDKVVFDDDSFTLTEQCPIVIGRESSRKISVCYKPEEAGAYSSIMRIYTNIPDRRIIDVEITGTVFEPNYILSAVKIDSDRKGGVLTVGLSNYNDITAVQMNVYGLEGMDVDRASLVLTERCDGFSAGLTVNDDGSMRIFIYSMTNSAIVGNEGDLFSFSFSDYKVVDNDLKVSITDIVLSNEDGKNMASIESVAPEITNSVTRIFPNNEQPIIIDLQGRRIDADDFSSLSPGIYIIDGRKVGKK